jgi:altronate dehydratase
VAAVVVIGIEPGWTKRIADGIRATGKPVAEFSIEQKGDLETIMDASWAAKEFVHYATELQREECPLSELWVSTKCGESDTTTGLGSCPTVGNMYDKLIPEGIYGCFGETSEITGAEHICKARAATPEVGERWYDVEGLSGRRDLRPPDRRPVRQPAHPRQHRGGPDHHRGKGAGQPREDRARPAATSTSWNRPRRRRRARASTSWTAPRPRPNA